MAGTVAPAGRAREAPRRESWERKSLLRSALCSTLHLLLPSLAPSSLRSSALRPLVLARPFVLWPSLALSSLGPRLPLLHLVHACPFVLSPFVPWSSLAPSSLRPSPLGLHSPLRPFTFYPLISTCPSALRPWSLRPLVIATPSAPSQTPLCLAGPISASRFPHSVSFPLALPLPLFLFTLNSIYFHLSSSGQLPFKEMTLCKQKHVTSQRA